MKYCPSLGTHTCTKKRINYFPVSVSSAHCWPHSGLRGLRTLPNLEDLKSYDSRQTSTKIQGTGDRLFGWPLVGPCT